MRASIWMAGLLAGLALAGRGHAQLFGGMSNGSPGGLTSAVGRSNSSAPSSWLGTGFRLRDIFQRSSPPISSPQPISYTTIPDPNSPEYLQAFGFRRLR
jgi:hypothetical protein